MTDYRTNWREVPSVVGAIKAAYRGASKRQRQMIRSWMRLVLADADGNDDRKTKSPRRSLKQ